MRKHGFVISVVLIVLLMAPLTLYSQTAGEQDGAHDKSSPVRAATGGLPTDQIIIKFKNAAAQDRLLRSQKDGRLAELGQTAGIDLRYQRAMSGDAHVLKLAERLSPSQVAAVAAKLTELDDVAYADPDRIRQIAGEPSTGPHAPTLLPNDPQYANQWHYKYTANTSEGLNLEPAWDISTGLTSTVVAVIDTGILNHADLAGRTVPGYDFITNIPAANDGDGRDADPSDPGDWYAANECGGTHPARDSSWHGTHVAGTIGAAANNSVGVAGVNWNAKILPVRVLGKCGGSTSDVVDGMRWAAGLSVPGVPNNANPAKVLNLSLGDLGACLPAEQSAIDDVVAAGTTVVISAGDDGLDASGYSPGNCNNVITVAATDRTGHKASYSNFGSVVEISAPGGETLPTAANGVLSTLNTGATVPASDAYEYYQGASMAAPHISGLASLILALRPGYSPANMLATIQSTARAFPAGSDCTTSICGSGIADAYGALSSFLPLDKFVYLPLILRNYPPVELKNTDFEGGATEWTEYSKNGWDLIMVSPFPLVVPAHSGDWFAWLGGDHDEISHITQNATVMASAPHLAYWHWVASKETTCGWDIAKVKVNGVTVDEYGLCGSSNTGDWVQYSVDLSAYVGQTVGVQIGVETNGLLKSNLWVDDVSFEASAVRHAFSSRPEVDSGFASALEKLD